MFESSLMRPAPACARAWSLSSAAVLQMMILGGSLIVPLYFIPPLPLVELKEPLPPARGVELVETPPELRAAAGGGGGGLELPRATRVFRAPSRIPDGVAMVMEEPGPVLSIGASSAEPFDGSRIPGVPFGSGPPVALPKAPPKPAPVAPPAPPEKKVYRVGGDVRPPELIFDVKPVYPPLARQARIQGTVRMEAVITSAGVIESLRLLHGHPLLAPAALDAVRQWRYRAATLNANPVDVALSIDVHFTLSQ
jgi:protein TonB